MGSPFLPILAKAFMDNLEEKVVQDNEYENYLSLYHRYIDDIIEELACKIYPLLQMIQESKKTPYIFV